MVEVDGTGTEPGRASRTAPRLELVIVAVPARNEGDHVVDCLTRIDHAARHWGGRVHMVLGADACADDTAAVARRTVLGAATLDVIEGNWRRPSRTRRTAVDHALATVAADHDPQRVWIANTDADCAVAADWITRQVDAADGGTDLVAGVVALDPARTPVPLLASFTAHYQLAPGERRHVHAANLGIRASLYREIGGWRATTSIGEEHHLVRAAKARGARIDFSDELVVATSSRTRSRVRGGFATVLDRLQRESAVIADSA